MRWNVEWGDKVETLNKMKAKGETPGALRARPKPTIHASTFLSAFNFLTSSRILVGDGVGSIPVSEVLAYAELMGLRRVEDRQELLYYVQVCDQAYLEALRRKSPKIGAAKHTTGRGRLPAGRRRSP